MNRPKLVTVWDLPDTRHVPDGYNMTEVPDNSAANVEFMIDRHNELVELMYDLAAHCGFKFSDEEDD